MPMVPRQRQVKYRDPLLTALDKVCICASFDEQVTPIILTSCRIKSGTVNILALRSI